MTTATTATTPAPYRLGSAERRVFVGLMLGMLVASISQTIVSPAMPRIVAELGGMDHYSWVATSAMLVSAITVPIVGKLSDLYGRRSFYLGGLVTFMLGSVLAGMSPTFGFLIGARVLQGVGMGTLMPLSQTIIGDLIPPRQRGRYQGIMGGVFGLSSIVGPLVGGAVTDHWGWRWLFYISLPVGLVAFGAIWRFLRLPHERRDAPVDILGIVLLAPALVCLLLATSLGGTTWAWDSTPILGLYVAGALLLGAFIWVETRAAEPVLPLRLFKGSVFTFANIASFALSMLMFGAMIYIPVYAQGVLGLDATLSGMILVPMSVAMIGMSVLTGVLVTRTGRYKELLVVGALVMGAGFWLLTQLGYDATQGQLTVAMVVFGLGLGVGMQTYTLVVQNVVMRRDLGVATAATQFFRNVGSTVGIAVFGTVMSTRAAEAIPAHLPPGAAAAMPAEGVGAGAVLDPDVLTRLPEPIVAAIRMGLADALHDVFALGLPLAGVVLLATLGIKALPLRDTVHTPSEAGQEILDGFGQSSADPLRVPLGRDAGPTRTKERLLGLQLELLCAQADRADRDLLRRAVTDVGGGDLQRGLSLLRQTAHMLTTEDPEAAAATERYAVEVAQAGARHGGVLSPDLRATLAAAATDLADDYVRSTVEPTVAQRYEGVDVTELAHVGGDLTSALLVDLHRLRRADAT